MSTKDIDIKDTKDTGRKERIRDLIIFIVTIIILLALLSPLAYRGYKDYKKQKQMANSDDPIECLIEKAYSRTDKTDYVVRIDELGKLSYVASVMEIEGHVYYRGKNNIPSIVFQPKKTVGDEKTTEDQVNAFNRMMKEDEIYKGMADYIISENEMSDRCTEILKGELTMESLLSHPEDTLTVLNALYDAKKHKEEFKDYKNFSVDETMQKYY